MAIPQLNNLGTLANQSAVNLQNTLSILDQTGNRFAVGEMEVMALDMMLSDENALYAFGELTIAASGDIAAQTKKFEMAQRLASENILGFKDSEDTTEPSFFSVTNFYLRINKNSRYRTQENPFDISAGRKQQVKGEILGQAMLSMTFIESLRFYNEIRTFYKSAATYDKASNAGADEIKGQSGNKFVWSGDETNANTQIKEKEALSAVAKTQIIGLKTLYDAWKAGTLTAEKMRTGAYAMAVEKIFLKISSLINDYTTMVNSSLIRMYVAPWLFMILRYSFSSIKLDTKDDIETKTRINNGVLNGVVIVEDKLLSINHVKGKNKFHKNEDYDLSKIAAVVMIHQTVPHAIGAIINQDAVKPKTLVKINHIMWESGVAIWPAKIDRIVILSNLAVDTYTI